MRQLGILGYLQVYNNPASSMYGWAILDRMAGWVARHPTFLKK